MSLSTSSKQSKSNNSGESSSKSASASASVSSSGVGKNKNTRKVTAVDAIDSQDQQRQQQQQQQQPYHAAIAKARAKGSFGTSAAAGTGTGTATATATETTNAQPTRTGTNGSSGSSGGRSLAELPTFEQRPHFITTSTGQLPTPPSPQQQQQQRRDWFRRTASERIPNTRANHNNNNNNNNHNDQRGSASVYSGFGELRDSIRMLRNKQPVAGAAGDAFTSADIDTIEQLGKNHYKTLEERRVQVEARTTSVRQNMYFLLMAMVVFQTLAILFFIYRGGLSVPDAILFAFYSTTTAGFGSVDIPFDTGFLIFVIVYIYIAIAALTILVAEVYMFIAIQTSEAKKSQDQETLRKQQGSESVQKIAKHPELAAVSDKIRENMENTTNAAAGAKADKKNRGRITGFLLQIAAIFKATYRNSEVGRIVIVVVYLGMLLIVGAVAMMFLEDWTFIEGLYFSTFVMTTVGYGDYAPTKVSSTWFVIFWMPLNVSFVSIYMGNLSRHYQMLCKANTARIYRNLHKRYIADPDDDDDDDQYDDDNDNDDYYDNDDNGKGERHRTHHNIGASSAKVNANNSKIAATTHKSIHSFADLHRFVLTNALVTAQDKVRVEKAWPKNMLDILSFPSQISSNVFRWNQARIPSFVLLILVQERIGNIIAQEVAGCHSEINSKDTTVAVSFFDIAKTSEKWSIPKAAHEAFRLVAFEAILYVGENKLITIGPDALFALSPSEVFDILSPFLAAMSDGGTMSGWLAKTEQLASLHFPRSALGANSGLKG